MKAILFDNSDAVRPELRQRVFRLLDDDGHSVLQGLVFSAAARSICERIAAGLGVELEYRGSPRGAGLPQPVESQASAEPVAVPPLTTVDPPAAYAVKKQAGFLF